MATLDASHLLALQEEAAKAASEVRDTLTDLRREQVRQLAMLMVDTLLPSQAELEAAAKNRQGWAKIMDVPLPGTSDDPFKTHFKGYNPETRTEAYPEPPKPRAERGEDDEIEVGGVPKIALFCGFTRNGRSVMDTLPDGQNVCFHADRLLKQRGMNMFVRFYRTGRGLEVFLVWNLKQWNERQREFQEKRDRARAEKRDDRRDDRPAPAKTAKTAAPAKSSAAPAPKSAAPKGKFQQRPPAAKRPWHEEE